MTSTEKEILAILQEECAEVIQAVSKCTRFGLENLKPGEHKTNRQHLSEELGDLKTMIDLCLSKNLVNGQDVEISRITKLTKLQQWSNIFN